MIYRPPRVGSASAHFGVWFLASAIGSTDGADYAPRPDPFAVVTAVLATTCALEALARVLAASQQAAVEHLRDCTRERMTRVLLELREGHPPV